MLKNLPRLIKSYSSHHRDALLLSVSNAVDSFSSSLQYMLLPIIIMNLYDEWTAALFVSGFTIFQILISGPISGALADRLGARNNLRISTISFILASALYLLFPTNTVVLFFVFGLIFTGFSFRSIRVYILRITERKEGGTIFGIETNIRALASFFSTLALPFFIPEQYHYIVFLGVIILKSLTLISTFFIKDDLDKIKHKKPEPLSQTLLPTYAIKHGLHFVRQNSYYPLLALGSAMFEGFFYGTIWFIFPIHFASQNMESITDGLQLGIYELITIFLAGYAGYMADHYHWRYIHSLGWGMILVGLAFMPFYSATMELVVVGIIIAIGNNLSSGATDHVLEEKDIDHKEDGAFMSLLDMVENVGYALAPLLAGWLYLGYGFEMTLVYIAISSGLISLWMLYMNYHLEKK